VNGAADQATDGNTITETAWKTTPRRDGECRIVAGGELNSALLLRPAIDPEQKSRPAGTEPL